MNILCFVFGVDTQGILYTMFIQIPDFKWLMLGGGGGEVLLQEHLDNAAGLLLQIKLFSYN